MKAHDLYDFLNKHRLATIATIDKQGFPNAAVIGFGQTKRLEIIFGTETSTRKYQNLLTSSHVALVIGWDEGITVQYEGEARELGSHELEVVEDNYWQKNPDAKAYSENPNERYFLVTPTWIRYTDTNYDPWDISQVNISDIALEK